MYNTESTKMTNPLSPNGSEQSEPDSLSRLPRNTNFTCYKDGSGAHL